MSVSSIILDILAVEGGFVNHPDDRGGPTKFGVTQATLAKYRGHLVTADDVRNLSQDEAHRILWDLYVVGPCFNLVLDVSPAVAEELVDTGVNMGVETAARFLQRALNALNDKQELYPNLVVDGRVGAVTVAALRSFLAHRLESPLLKALNCLQGARYIELCEARERNESFVYGWLLQRVRLEQNPHRR